MLSPFGVEHSVSKSRRRDTAAAAAGAGIGGVAAPRLHRSAQLKSSARHVAASDAHERAAERLAYWPAGKMHTTQASRRWHRGLKAANRSGSARLRIAAGAAGATAGAAGAVAASRKVRKSAFGVEHPVSKAVRLDRVVEAVRKPAKVKLAPVKTPLADARFGPVKKGAALDDALVTPARLRVVGAKPQNQVPPAAAKPARPAPGQRLNNAIAATGGSSS